MRQHIKRMGFIDTETFGQVLTATFVKFSFATQLRRPVVFVAYVGALFATLLVLLHAFEGRLTSFELQVTIWLWLMIFFANFAEALAEIHGKIYTEGMRQITVNTYARLIKDGKEIQRPPHHLKIGDIILCESGNIIPVDGDIAEGIATVDESSITGESALVIRESGGDRCAVTAGTKVVHGHLLIKVTTQPGESFLDKLTYLTTASKKYRTPSEISLNILLFSITIMFLLMVSALKFFADYSYASSAQNQPPNNSPLLYIVLLVCLMPISIRALMTAIAISGINRLIQANVITKSSIALEVAGDVDLLILDKTGTITLGNRMASEFLPLPGVTEEKLAEVAQMASMADETPEGRSIVILAKKMFHFRGVVETTQTLFRPFSLKSRISGIDFYDPQGRLIRSIRKGAQDTVSGHVSKLGGVTPPKLQELVDSVAKQGGTPLIVSDHDHIIGVIHLKDIVKGGMRERCEELRKIGIRTVMITGDNILTAAAIAAEAGVDDFIAEATPEDKLDLIRSEQSKGYLVAMTGDGIGDAPALAQADVGLAMNTGTQASREASNMIDLDSNPTKLLDVVKIGKEVLMTRGTLTIFNIANNIGKYLAIIPAMFANLYASPGEIYGPLHMLNVMRLSSPQSAILSTLIYSTLTIALLTPLVLRGISYKAESAQHLLRKNYWIYGIGGLVLPFIGIKFIDICLTLIGLS